MGILDFFSGKPTMEKYAQALILGVKAAGEVRDLEFDPDDSRITVAGDSKRFLFLTNMFDEYRSLPRTERARLLNNHVQSWFASEQIMPSKFLDAAGDLLPRIRENTFHPITKLQLGAQGLPDGMYYGEPLTKHLTVSIVYDLPTSMREVAEDSFKEWDVTFEYALGQAVRNLRQMSNGDFEEIAPGVLTAPWEDDYQSARILLVDRIAKLNLKGRPVATVPVRNQLFICGSDDPAGLAVLTALTEKSFDENPRSISAIPVILENGEWSPYLPPEGDTFYAAIKMLWLKTEMRDYGDQKAALDTVHEKDEIDIFVASYSGIKKESGEPFSYAVLSRGVDTLLPRTDLVAVLCNPEEGNPIMVPWRAFTEVCGDLMEDANLVPVRYRIREFPSDAQLEEMAALEKDA